MKHQLDNANILLLKNGFIVKNLRSGCFNILARKGSQILLIKVLQDANSISKEYAEEMKRIAAQLTAVPLIISEKANEPLQDHVVYTRFGSLHPKSK